MNDYLLTEINSWCGVASASINGQARSAIRKSNMQMSLMQRLL